MARAAGIAGTAAMEHLYPDNPEITTRTPQPHKFSPANDQIFWWFPMVGGLLAITLIYWVYYCLKRCWSCGWDDKKKQKRILNNNQDNYGTLKVDDDTFTMSNFSNFYQGPQVVIYDKENHGYTLGNTIICGRTQYPSDSTCLSYDTENTLETEVPKQTGSSTRLKVSKNSCQDDYDWQSKTPLLIQDKNGNSGYSYNGEFILPWNKQV